MPIYAYKCDACGFAKDVLQKISDPVLTVCPSCGAPSFNKQVTAAGFQLKGSGWYVTDFKGGGGGATAAPAPAPAAGGSEGKAEPAKTEAKSDAKPSESSGTSSSSTPSAAAGGCGSGCACH